MKLPHLTPRLQKIYDLVPPCDTVADIGTDHAYIPVCLTLLGKCKKAIASDIKKGPIERANSTVKAYSAEALVETRLGGGLETISENEANTIIIAGMGGILIGDILEASKAVAKSAQRLILQPMTALTELREYLNENGYIIEKEYPVSEEEKVYIIFFVKAGNDKKYSPAQLYMGKQIEKNEAFPKYRENRLKKLNRQIKGLSLSDNEENKERLASLKSLKEMIENENL